MGIQKRGMELVHRVIDRIPGQYNMMTWGNAYIRRTAQEWLRETGKISPDFVISAGNQWPAKEYFPLTGANHKSIDMNCKDGSLYIDLRLPIEDGDDDYGVLDWADLIFDAGTSEHVSNQYTNWKNAHDICRVGGYMVHILPHIGYWKGHCEYKYDVIFFEKLSEIMNYQIIELDSYIESEDRCDVLAIMQKTTDSTFMSEDVFNTLPIYIESGQFNDRGLYPYAYE